MRVTGTVGLLLALATPAMAQVTCMRLDTAFSCADGTSLAIYDDPWRGARGRSRPRGETCLLHGSHVHCNGILSDVP